MERMASFAALHNCATPHRIDDRARPFPSDTHASVAGIGGEPIDWHLGRMLTHRHVYSHSTRRFSWIRRIWLHQYDNPPAVSLSKDGVRVRRVALSAAEIPEYLRV